MNPSSLSLRRMGGTALVLIAACLLSGCGKKFGSVSGSVKYKGKALTGGQVAFIPAAPGGETATGLIDSSGSYTIEKVVAGPCKITVFTSAAGSGGKAAGKMMDAGKMGKADGGKSKVGVAGDVPSVQVPSKFAEPDTSGLSFEVKQGTNSHDINITN
jgi:hypothetical protein